MATRKVKEVHILGAGALGTLFAAKLASIGIHTSILHRNHGRLFRLNVTGSNTLTSAQEADAETIRGPGRPITTLLVATKAHAVQDAVASIAARLDHGAPSLVVLLNNGALAVAGSLRLPTTTTLVVATTTHGAWLESAEAADADGVLTRTVRHAGHGSTWLGPLHEFRGNARA